MEQLPRRLRGQLPPEFVLQNQRARLIAALIACVQEEGYSKTTLQQIAKRAHVSKADFYESFENTDEAFLAAYDETVERIREVVLLACASRKDWGQGVCAALAALLAHLASEPARAHLVFVEGVSAVGDVHAEAVRRFVPYLSDGAPAVAGGSPSEATAEAVVGGIVSLLGRHILAGKTKRLKTFFPEIAEFALVPYVGSDEARRIISAV